jgi:hypothetical protein
MVSLRRSPICLHALIVYSALPSNEDMSWLNFEDPAEKTIAEKFKQIQKERDELDAKKTAFAQTEKRNANTQRKASVKKMADNGGHLQ